MTAAEVAYSYMGGFVLQFYQAQGLQEFKLADDELGIAEACLQLYLLDYVEGSAPAVGPIFGKG